MKTEMAMLPNGNYEKIISPIQHHCYSDDRIIKCIEYGWNMGKLYLKIEDGDPYEDGYSNSLLVNHCPFCGYHPKNKD